MFHDKIFVSNIKISLRVLAKRCYLHKLCSALKPTKQNESFFVHRKNGLVYCIYFTGHVNVTGIKKQIDVTHAICYLKLFSGIQAVIILHALQNYTNTFIVGSKHFQHT